MIEAGRTRLRAHERALSTFKQRLQRAEAMLNAAVEQLRT
jgi:hypothetical protein